MIIAEIGQAHDGSVGMLHSYIDALANTGVDAVKFQTHIADAESSIHEAFRIPFSYVDNTRFDYWKRMELTIDQWVEIRTHCHNKGLLFIASPFSCKAVKLLKEAEVDIYKIGSGEVSNHLLLNEVSATQKPVILSSGLSGVEELDSAISLLKRSNTNISILHCVTAYPAHPCQWNLHTIKFLKERYHIPAGLSDHSGGITCCLAATALGAEVLEFHVVFDKRMFGPDAPASIEIDEVTILVQGVRDIQTSLKSTAGKDEQVSDKIYLKKMFGKSLCVNNLLPAGHVITIQDLEAKKPAGFGLPPGDFENIVGRKLLTTKNQWDFLTSQDIIQTA